MAKVKTWQRGLGGRTVQLVVNCNADGLFTCQLPDEIAQRLGKARATGATLAECEAGVDMTSHDSWSKIAPRESTERPG